MEEPTNKPYISFRASVDLAMGILYIFVSAYCMMLPAILEEYGKATVYTLGSLFIAYGLFRSVRGILKFKSVFGIKRSTRKYINNNN